MRTPARFTVEVPDIGTFTFRRRTMQDQLLIQAEFAKLSAGIEDLGSRMAAEALATLPRILEQGPPGFDLAELDPLDPEDWARLGAIYGGLRDAEVKFRGGAAPQRQAVGPGDVGDGGVPVAAPLRAAAD